MQTRIPITSEAWRHLAAMENAKVIGVGSEGNTTYTQWFLQGDGQHAVYLVHACTTLDAHTAHDRFYLEVEDMDWGPADVAGVL